MDFSFKAFFHLSEDIVSLSVREVLRQNRKHKVNGFWQFKVSDFSPFACTNVNIPFHFPKHIIMCCELPRGWMLRLRFRN